jgi:rod shape determining protein RodA
VSEALRPWRPERPSRRSGLAQTRRMLSGARRELDWRLLAGVACLVGIGAMSIYAATRNHLIATGHPGSQYLARDLVNLAIAMPIVAIVARSDYRLWSAWAPLAYLGLGVGLLLVLTPLGASVNGAHGWFAFGPAQIEPSEFMKLGLILLLASMLGGARVAEDGPRRRDLLLAMVATAVPMMLILAEPALGIALMLGVVALTILVLAEAPGGWIASLLAGAVICGIAAFSFHLLKPYQEQRFSYLNNPTAHTQTGYQIRESEIAIGNGGLTGEGFLLGSQTDGGFVPEQQTDFIFTVAAEEGGLGVGVLLLTALGVVLMRGMAIASSADPMGKLLATGVTSWFAFQSFVNIGMTLGIMPVTGLPLPFVSYGGSSLLADLVGVAVLLSVHRHSQGSSRPSPRY